jgi:hypothetical protein
MPMRRRIGGPAQIDQGNTAEHQLAPERALGIRELARGLADRRVVAGIGRHETRAAGRITPDADRAQGIVPTGDGGDLRHPGQGPGQQIGQARGVVQVIGAAFDPPGDELDLIGGRIEVRTPWSPDRGGRGTLRVLSSYRTL